MLISLYHLHDVERVRARRLVVRDPVIIIGSDPSCTIAIGDDPLVGPRHAQITVRAVDVVVVPLAGVTLVNDAPIAGPTVCRPGDTLQLGQTVLKMRPEDRLVTTSPLADRGPQPGPENPNPPRPTATYNPPALRPLLDYQPPGTVPPPRVWRDVLSTDPTEQHFLGDLRDHPDDKSTRSVYADWLEDRGQLAKAEIVRGVEYPEHDDLLRESDAAWRAITSTAMIEDCDHRNCPRRWDRLAAAREGSLADRDERVRYCTTCTKPVRFCLHVLDVTGSMSRGEAAVRDAALVGDPHPGDTIEDPSPRRR